MKRTLDRVEYQVIVLMRNGTWFNETVVGTGNHEAIRDSVSKKWNGPDVHHFEIKEVQ